MLCEKKLKQEYRTKWCRSWQVDKDKKQEDDQIMYYIFIGFVFSTASTQFMLKVFTDKNLAEVLLISCSLMIDYLFNVKNPQKKVDLIFGGGCFCVCC